MRYFYRILSYIINTNKPQGASYMEQVTNNSKCCATCAYWLGYRYPHRLGFVEVNSKMDKGACGSDNPNIRRSYQAIYSCRNYCKWQVLR